jgi:hypothetical protein
VDWQQVLKTWGKTAPPAGPLAGPLHPDILDILTRFETVSADQYFSPVVRAYAGRPFQENDWFTQIGTWLDGSEVLANRDSSDPRIYIADIERTDARRPLPLAKDIREYLAKAWDYHQDSLGKGRT